MIRTFRDISDRYAPFCVPVPYAGAGICDICHGAPGSGFSRCKSCYFTTRQVTHPIGLVVPISLYQVGGQLHRLLRAYKDAPDETARGYMNVDVAAILARFLDRHAGCIAGISQAWDTVTIVPSTSGRAEPHPLESAIQRIGILRGMFARLLKPGTTRITHGAADDDGYEVTTGVLGRRILLIDDTFTSGARVQSAASALQLSGATVVAAVALGRVIDPGFSAESKTLWDEARKTEFTFDKCCLEFPILLPPSQTSM